MLFLFLINLLNAKEIDYNQAENIAVKWMEKVTNKRLKVATQKAYFLSNFKARRDSSKQPYYIFNLESGGWVIVADDDINSPILAYSDKSSIDPYNLPPQFKWWLESVASELRRAKNLAKKGVALKGRVANSSTTKTYSLTSTKIEPAYATSAPSGGVGPLLNTSWGQGRGYNEYCPKDARSIEGNGHVPAGCVAVAMAQIMNYFTWPPRGIGSNSYVPSSNPQYGRLGVDFGSSSYSWRGSDKARVIYHAGVAVNMDYGPYGSGAYITSADSALRSYFRYTTSGVIQKSSDSDWDRRLIASLNRGSPVLYQGKGKIVHVFVCDGYKKVGDGYMYHFNWGWNGRANGWFRVGNMTPYGDYSFNAKNYAIFNIYPNDPSYGLDVKRSSGSVAILAPIFVLLFGVIGFLSNRRKL